MIYMHKPYLIPRRAVTRCNQIRNDITFRYNGIPSGMSLQSSESDRFVYNLPQRNLTSILRNLKNILWERVTYTKFVSMNNLSSNYKFICFYKHNTFLCKFLQTKEKEYKEKFTFWSLSVDKWLSYDFFL